MEGIRDVHFNDLWCQCQGNANATPHVILVQQQMTRMHADAQKHALWYVCIVLSVYVIGLVVIIKRSGLHERHTALSALSLCFSSFTSVSSSSLGGGGGGGGGRGKTNGKKTNHPSKPQKDNSSSNRTASPKRSRPQKQREAAESLQMKLMVPDEEEEDEEGEHLGPMDGKPTVTTLA
ncbi:uncharacterized protein [Palaemon carinicauda]|uniref:uncharacterized protein n=1 Tax=Palaemon carinicauda TaxID=392227 RepID=UPI0035B5B8EA